MCEISSCGGRVAQDYLSSVETCSTPFNYDTVSPTKENVLKAMLAIDLSVMQRPETLAFACSCATADPAACVVCTEMLANATTMLARYLTPGAIANLRSLAVPVEVLIRDRLNVTMVQFVTDAPGGVLDATSNFTLSAVNLFSDVRLGFAAWLYLIDWVEGRREVVTLVGDAGDVALTTMSDHAMPLASPANPREIPTSFSFYAFRLSQYITGVLIGVACLVCLYIVTSVGHIEGANMFTFNPVAGLTWVGRPMILLRSLTAICVLSTSVVTLAASPLGLVTRFAPDAAPWYTTFLASAEINWLVFVLEDILSAITRETVLACTITNPVAAAFVTSVATQSTMLSWIVSGTWSAAVPVAPVAAVGRTACVVTAVDLDVSCASGFLAYGSVGRFGSLIGVAAASTVVANLLKRVLLTPTGHMHKVVSAFLPAIAKYSFNFTKWEAQDVLFLDKPSAALAGVLIFELGAIFYVFDVKNWRSYAINVAAPRKSIRLSTTHKEHLYHALPLIE
ncbi:Aste57867_16057 [Aphanomyces stellatus]|uniref:Aste57867_16057 protein n=1 Tax=Aphanomyces stellatus TaxID=120398 RepID=A0A485L4K6_9STRA|nr:hypothetical protein As57867_016001 [Aphanomyces stellatus]VFT92841.1 Aste57867_16057 [Aphanomyces stellatus]